MRASKSARLGGGVHRSRMSLLTEASRAAVTSSRWGISPWAAMLGCHCPLGGLGLPQHGGDEVRGDERRLVREPHRSGSKVLAHEQHVVRGCQQGDGFEHRGLQILRHGLQDVRSLGWRVGVDKRKGGYEGGGRVGGDKRKGGCGGKGGQMLLMSCIWAVASCTQMLSTFWQPGRGGGVWVTRDVGFGLGFGGCGYHSGCNPPFTTTPSNFSG